MANNLSNSHCVLCKDKHASACRVWTSSFLTVKQRNGMQYLHHLWATLFTSRKKVQSLKEKKCSKTTTWIFLYSIFRFWWLQFRCFWFCWDWFNQRGMTDSLTDVRLQTGRCRHDRHAIHTLTCMCPQGCTQHARCWKRAIVVVSKNASV